MAIQRGEIYMVNLNPVKGRDRQADEQGNDDHHPGPAGAGPPDLKLRRRSCRHGRLLITFRSHSGLVMPQSGQR